MAKRTNKWMGIWGMAAMAVLLVVPAVRAGDLQPSAAPAPTMKTLDEVEPRIPIDGSSSPVGMLTISQSGSYYLTGDRLCSGNGISINADNVTIDLMGYSLVGPGSGSSSGILFSGRKNIEIRNGSIRSFGTYGVYDGSGTAGGQRMIDLRILFNGYYGMVMNGKHNLVQNCLVAENANKGISMGTGAIITGNVVYGNGEDGIAASDAATISGNTVYQNVSYGISGSSGCIVTGNTVYNNGDTGIDLASFGVVTGNMCYSQVGDGVTRKGCGIRVNYSTLVSGNVCTRNYGDGINVSSHCTVTGNQSDSNGLGTPSAAGIHALGADTRIEGNNVTGNDRGIDVDAAGNIIVKNTASGNPTNYDIAAANAVGTISASPVGAGAWDNFSY